MKVIKDHTSHSTADTRCYSFTGVAYKVGNTEQTRRFRSSLEVRGVKVPIVGQLQVGKREIEREGE